MAGITMCSGEGCLMKSSCHCYTAPQNQWRQGFFMYPPVKEDGSCNYYSPNYDDGDNEGFGL